MRRCTTDLLSVCSINATGLFVAIGFGRLSGVRQVKYPPQSVLPSRIGCVGSKLIAEPTAPSFPKLLLTIDPFALAFSCKWLSKNEGLRLMFNEWRFKSVFFKIPC